MTYPFFRQDPELRKHMKRVDLPDIDFDPKREKSKRKIFKLISFEFAHAEDEDDQIPELGLSTFQVRLPLRPPWWGTAHGVTTSID